MLIDINLMNFVPYLHFFILSLVSPSGHSFNFNDDPVTGFKLSPPGT